MESKPVKNLEENYLVFNDGRIFSIKNNKFLKPVLNYRYMIVHLFKNGKAKNFYIHRLVAEAFCSKGKGKTQVNHIDSNRINNHYTNLEWVTSKENVSHFINSKNYKKRVMSKDQKEKLAQSKHKNVKCLITGKIYKSISEFAKYKNVSLPQASMKLNNKYHNNLNGILL